MEEKEKELEQKYLEFQMLEQQFKQLQKQLQALDAQLFELNLVNESLSDLKKIKKGTELLATISPGIFIKVKIDNTEKLKVNVGSNVVVEKTISETKELLASQEKNIMPLREKFIKQLQNMNNKLQKVEGELLKLTKPQNV